jgi:hypothetical protein
MKKILTILALASAATFVHAQGTIILQNGNASFLVSTNGVGNVTGPTTKTAGTFDYAVLTAAFGGPAPSSNPLDAAWSGAALTGANFTLTAGGILGQGTGAGAATAGSTWGAPTGPDYTDGTEKYFIIVGWSSTYASTWATFEPLLIAGLAPGGYYGTSAEGFGYSGGGPETLPAPSLFSPSTGMPGALTGGFTLFLQPVPEPATIALASLGGLSLLAFRRRNKA